VHSPYKNNLSLSQDLKEIPIYSPKLASFDTDNTYTNIWTNTDKNVGKGEATPVQAWTGPEGFRQLRIPDFMIVDL
jgi:predicted extracellular nuclease